MQHPFLFVGLLDAVVGLELGVRTVTGVLSTAEISPPNSDEQVSNDDNRKQEVPKSAREQLVARVREEAGLAASNSTGTAVVALVDVRESHQEDIVGNESLWLKGRNAMYREIRAGEKNYVLVCEAGRCYTI